MAEPATPLCPKGPETFDIGTPGCRADSDHGGSSEEDVFGHLGEKAFSPTVRPLDTVLPSLGRPPSQSPGGASSSAASRPAVEEQRNQPPAPPAGREGPSPLLTIGHQGVDASHRVLQKLGVVWCSTCGSFSTGKVVRSLSAPCRGSASRAGASVISRMSRGLLPTSQIAEWPLRASTAPPEGRVVRLPGASDATSASGQAQASEEAGAETSSSVAELRFPP